jgi:hypothetical protein
MRRDARVLRDLVSAPVSLADLRSAGVVLDPGLAFTLAAAMIKRRWTKGSRFTLAHRQPNLDAPDAYLQVADGARPRVSHVAPLASADATIVCAAGEILGVLDPAHEEQFQVEGESAHVAQLRAWIKLAQSG